MDSTMGSATTETKTYKEGQLIKGKDFIRLESPLILPSKNTPLLTEAQDFVGAINELFQEGTGANGAFRAVFDDNSGNLTIVVQEGNKYADYLFGYEYTDYSDEITTQTVVGEETVKTTRSFSKRIVTSLLDASGAVLLVTDYNADNGVILGYTDGSGDVVYTADWRSEYESVMTQSQGASSAAIAWVIARNMEQSTSLSEEKQAYKDGLKVGVKGGADITEEYDKDGNTINLTTGENGSVTEPFIGNFTEGIYCYTDDGSYVCIRLDMNLEQVTGETGATQYIDKGKIIYDAYDANGTLVESQAVRSQSGHWWESTTKWQSGASSTYRVELLTFNLSSLSGVAWSRWRNNAGNTIHSYWENPTGQVVEVLSKAVRISNFPPEATIN